MTMHFFATHLWLSKNYMNIFMLLFLKKNCTVSILVLRCITFLCLKDLSQRIAIGKLHQLQFYCNSMHVIKFRNDEPSCRTCRAGDLCDKLRQKSIRNLLGFYSRHFIEI